MILYLCIIILGGCVISVANALGFGADMGRTFAIVFVGIVIEILIDGITAAVCRGLPQKCVHYHGKVFQVACVRKISTRSCIFANGRIRYPKSDILRAFVKTR